MGERKKGSNNLSKPIKKWLLQPNKLTKNYYYTTLFLYYSFVSLEFFFFIRFYGVFLFERLLLLLLRAIVCMCGIKHFFLFFVLFRLAMIEYVMTTPFFYDFFSNLLSSRFRYVNFFRYNRNRKNTRTIHISALIFFYSFKAVRALLLSFFPVFLDSAIQKFSICYISNLFIYFELDLYRISHAWFNEMICLLIFDSKDKIFTVLWPINVV